MGEVPANFHGKPGRSGRKSAYDERGRADAAVQMFFKKIDLEKIDRIIAKVKARKGKVSVAEVMLVKALTGNERLMAMLGDKAMASKMKHEIGGSVSRLLNQQHDTIPDTQEADREPPADRKQGAEAGSVPPQPDSGAV